LPATISRILAAGPPVTVRGGHCWFFGGDVDLTGDGDAQLREQVRRNIDAGADLVKVMASGGQLTPGGAAMYESQFTTGQLGVIVAEARRAGLRVAAHAHGADAISSAVEAGVHTVEHCGWMSGPGSYRHHGPARTGSCRRPARRRRRPAHRPRRPPRRPARDDPARDPPPRDRGDSHLGGS
jgi:hypothetical protein